VVESQFIPGQQGGSPMSHTLFMKQYEEQKRKLIENTALFQKYGYSQAESAKMSHQMVDANKRNIASFNGMTESMGKAVLKVTLWMAAISVVLGAMKKVGEVIELWKDLEVTLERIGITTGEIGLGLYQYFEKTADVAIAMGMPIQNTLRGMDLALRATASLENQVVRTATATMMLRDASILGNVAGMNFDQAIDILVGSLRQTGMELDQGIILLDKWVAVARNAAVSVNDLSQGFAIMSSAAASAGVNIDQVNGIIAALSESVTLGPIEVGNAIRALMATIYNPGSIKIMSRYGVAVKDATGELRSFWDIMTQLSSMVVTGALDESQIMEIAKAAGAGQRRYAQFIALLQNWTNAMRAADISANAQNEALKANQRIVDTLTNAYDQFTAAQNKFWYAFGEKSGIIGDMTQAFQGFASLFNNISGWNEGLFKTLKILMEIAAALAIIKVSMIGWAKLQGMGIGAGMGGFFGMGKYPMAAGAGAPGYYDTTQGARGAPLYVRGTPPSGGQAFGRRMITPSRGVAGIAGAGMVGGLIAGEITQSTLGAWGGGIGAGIGMALGGPVGAAAGGAIGAVIGKAIEDSARTVEDILKGAMEDFLESMPAELRSALTPGIRDISLAGFAAEPISEEELPYAEALEKARETIELQERAIKTGGTAWEKFSVNFTAIRAAMEALSSEGFAASWEIMQKETGTWVRDEAGEWITLTELHTRQLDALLPKEQQIKDIRDALLNSDKEALSLEDELAVRAKDIRVEENTQLVVNREINKLKEKSLDIGTKEFLLQRSQIESSQIAYSNLQAQIERFAPQELPRFRQLVPDFGAFMQFEPGAYQPLQEVLATQISITKQQEEGVLAMKQLERYWVALPGFSATYTTNLEDILAQENYWSALSKGLLADDIEAIGHLGRINEFLQEKGVLTKDLTADEMTSISLLVAEGVEHAKIVDLLQREYDINNDMLKDTMEYMPRYKTPGQFAFLQGIDAGKIQSLLDKYNTMFSDFIDKETSDLKTYYAFARTEEGVTTGQAETFVAYGEVWNAMLQELQGIEKNTSKMLEAEYNIPGWYQTPNRYMALRQTGGAGGFGPASEGMWGDWLEFVSSRSMQSGGIVRETGPYFLHKREVVVSGETLTSTNVLLGNSYRVLLISQQYLSNINLGILGVRQEIQQLRQQLASTKTAEVGSSDFDRVTKANYVGISSLGVNRK